MELAKTRFPKEIEEIKKVCTDSYENIADKNVKRYVATFYGIKKLSRRNSLL